MAQGKPAMSNFLTSIRYDEKPPRLGTLGSMRADHVTASPKRGHPSPSTNKFEATPC